MEERWRRYGGGGVVPLCGEVMTGRGRPGTCEVCGLIEDLLKLQAGVGYVYPSQLRTTLE